MFYLSLIVLIISLILLSPFLIRIFNWLLDPVLSSRRDPSPLSYQPKYIDTKTQTSQLFPSLLLNDSSLILSIIIPAYNEELRISSMIEATLKFFNNKKTLDSKFNYELIIVDDGSKDSTFNVAMKYSELYGSDLIRVMKLSQNQGKGGAVQQGMLHARGELLLMADADGATEISDYNKLEKSLQMIKNSFNDGISIGSRAHLAESSTVSRAWYRTVLMHGFHFLVSSLCVRSIRDTQCGFKLFTRTTAKKLFPIQHLRRWCFDVELLFIAQKLNIPISEISVKWEEIPGSKLQIIESSLLMARDLIIIRAAYATKFWTMEQK